MATKSNLPSTAVGRRRLLKLASLLEKDAKNKKGISFDLGSWGYVGDKSNPVSCGTNACAMGLAVASGTFRRAGLLPPRCDGSLTPRMRGASSGFDAAAKLFSISGNESDWLFDPSYYSERYGARGEIAVAKRIRRFVAGKTAP